MKSNVSHIDVYYIIEPAKFLVSKSRIFLPSDHLQLMIKDKEAAKRAGVTKTVQKHNYSIVHVGAETGTN